MSNVTDDWNCHWSRCVACGARYHESEGGCDCTDEGSCAGCGEHCGSFDADRDDFICDECCVCENCGEVGSSAGKVDGYPICTSCAPDELWLVVRPTGNGEGDDIDVGSFTSREYAEEWMEPLDRLYRRTPKGTVLVEEVAA